MSDRDEVMFLSDSMSNKNSSDESSSDELQVVGIIQPYADEPLVHTAMRTKMMKKIKMVSPLQFCGQDLKTKLQLMTG